MGKRGEGRYGNCWGDVLVFHLRISFVNLFIIGCQLNRTTSTLGVTGDTCTGNSTSS